MILSMKFKAHFIGFKYLKSTGTWRMELDLFQEDKSQVPDHVANIEKIIDVSYTEWIDPMISMGVTDLFNDSELQLLLGTNDPESTRSAIEKRTGVNFSDPSEEEMTEIIDTIKKSMNGG